MSWIAKHPCAAVLTTQAVITKSTEAQTHITVLLTCNKKLLQVQQQKGMQDTQVHFLLQPLSDA